MIGVLLAAALLGAQAPAPDSGLLIGLDDGTLNPRRLWTLWVSVQSGSVSLVQLRGRLLVPRRDGFWWLSLDPADTGKVPGAWRVGSDRGPLQLGRKARNVEEAEAEDEFGCTGRSQDWRIEFVNDSYLALTEESGGSCFGRSSQDFQVRVLRYEPGSDTVAGPAVAAPEMLAGLGPQVMREAAGLTGQEIEPIDPLSWSIQRGRGRWVARGARMVGGSVAWRNDFDLPGVLPARAVRNPDLRPGWDVVLDSVPDALDAFSSPSGGLLVVLTRKELLAYLPLSGRLGRPALRRANPVAPNRSTPVMVEWATGPHVRTWDTVVRSALESTSRMRSRQPPSTP
jgi:hypothetical protein